MGSFLQLTLALLKPDIAANPYFVHQVQKLILRKEFFIVKRKCVRWNRENAKQFYKQHEGRFFHGRLVEFMSSGPIIALVLARENAISEWRNLMGPTKVYQTRFTHPNTIRGMFGLSDTRNTVHGSDSPRSVEEEISLFFPEFDPETWLTHEKDSFNYSKEVVFDESAGIHRNLGISSEHESVLLQKSPNPERLNRELALTHTWTNFYVAKKEPLDWFVDYEEVKDYLRTFLCESESCHMTVVDMGCGSSELGPNLAKDFPNLEVYCVDVSLESLHILSGRLVGGNCTLAVADVCQRLPLEADSVKIVIDKGTSDAILRHKIGRERFESMLREVRRVLQRDGVLLQITTDCPETRLDQLKSIENTKTSISYTQLKNCTSNDLPVFVYAIKFS